MKVAVAMTDEQKNPAAPTFGWDAPPSMEGPPPEPDPDHNRRILKEKRFEILTVVGLIVAGTAFLMWRGVSPQVVIENPETLGDAEQAVQYAGFKPQGQTSFFARTAVTLSRQIDGFECNVDLIGRNETEPLETAVIWLEPNPEQWPPTETQYQDAVNMVSSVGVRLVTTASDAIQTAVDTSLVVNDADRPHDKGVASTQDGWKITYVVFKNFDEDAEPRPALTLVIQSLDAASDPALEDLNRGLYAAVREGIDVKTRLAELADSPEAE
jgi:hypothetical protein